MLRSMWLTQLPPPRRIFSRVDYLRSVSRGKRVLHVGCVDAPFLEERLAAQNHLHVLLSQTASHVVGVDIDREGILALAALGFDVICDNVETPSILQDLEPFEVVIAGEVIEHSDNPGLFVDSLKPLLKSEGVLIVTTPNAFRWYNPLFVLFKREFVHPDHTGWYSYATMCKLLRRHGFCVSEVGVSNLQKLVYKHDDRLLVLLVKGCFNLMDAILRHSLVRIAPFLGDTLVFKAKVWPG